MRLSVLLSWLAKGVGIFLSFFNARLLIELVGVEGLTVNAIMLSLMTWFALLNLGLPIRVQNMISKCRAEAVDYETLKNTAYSLLVLLFIAFTPLVALVGLIVKHWLLVEYPAVSMTTVLFTCFAIFLSGLGMLFTRILYAEHLGVYANTYPVINTLGTCLALLLLRELGITAFNIVLMAAFLPYFVVFIMAAVQVKAFRVWSLDKAVVHSIWVGSKSLLLFATLSATTLAVDYLVMSQLLTAQDIARYNLSSRLFMTILMAHEVLLAATWPVVSELLHGHAFEEAKKRIFKTLRYGVVLGVLCGGGIVLTTDWVVSFLSKGKVADIPFALTVGWFLYIMVRVWSDTFAMGLLSIGYSGKMNRYLPIQAVISVVAQCVLAKYYGVAGVVAGVTLSFLLTSAWILPQQFFRMTRDKVVHA